MLGLVSAERPEGVGPIARWRGGWQRGYGTRVGEYTLFGRPALFVRHQMFDGLRESRAERRLDDLCRLLHRSGVDKVAFSDDFPGGRKLADRGLEPVSCRYLYTCLAGDVGAFVAAGGRETAVCVCRSVGLHEERAIRALCTHFRYLMLITGRDGEVVCRNLRRKYGLPVMENPTASQVRRADFALVFQPPERGLELGDRCIAFSPDIAVYRRLRPRRAITGLSLELPEDIRGAIPEAFAPNPILSEAALRGQVDPGKIKIHDVSLDKPP